MDKETLQDKKQIANIAALSVLVEFADKMSKDKKGEYRETVDLMKKASILAIADYAIHGDDDELEEFRGYVTGYLQHVCKVRDIKIQVAMQVNKKTNETEEIEVTIETNCAEMESTVNVEFLETTINLAKELRKHESRD